MKFTLKLRGKSVTLAYLNDALAVRPAEQLRTAEAASKIVKRFRTAAATDDARGGRFGIALPARDRKRFEKAGWLFVEAREALSRAANIRSSVTDADAVRPIFVDRGGNTLVGTELVTVRLPGDMPEARALDVLKSAGLKLSRKLKFVPNLFEARLPARKPFAEVIAELQADSRFLFAEPDFLQSLGGRLTPSDPDYPNQWQHANDGSNGGIPGADIHSEKAWDKTRGQGVRIAVIDNGIWVNHPDLKAGIVGGGHFTPSGTGDATFVRHTPGAGGFPKGPHGTFCLGMAGARMNNKRGGCGSAPEADLIPVACLTDQVGTQTTLARAVAYAANPTLEDGRATAADGAHVIACSLGPNGAHWDLTSALDLAIVSAAQTGRQGLGVPILWAVSNGPFEIALDEVSSHPDVLAVGRSNRNDLEDGSAFGPKLEFLAPGRDVFSTTETGSKYGFGTGTSYFCPLAAGVAALVLAAYPAWTRDQVRQRLQACCDQIGGVSYDTKGRHPEYGFGRLNAEQAVQ